jgi:hypothetical protein
MKNKFMPGDLLTIVPSWQIEFVCDNPNDTDKNLIEDFYMHCSYDDADLVISSDDNLAIMFLGCKEVAYTEKELLYFYKTTINFGTKHMITRYLIEDKVYIRASCIPERYGSIWDLFRKINV